MRILCVALLLAGCASHAPIVKPEPVDIPIAVTCRLPRIAHPVWPIESLKPSDNLFVKVQRLLATNELRAGYEAQLEAAVAACQ